MSTSAIEAGRAFVRLLVNDTDLQKGLTKAQNKLKMFAASTGQLGRQLMGLSAAIAAPGVAGAKAFMDFERQMAEVSTMLDDPQKFMGQFTEGVKRLAVEFGESTDTLAKGLYDILSASVPPAQAMDVLAASVRAAKAGLSETGVAADAITTILNAYQMSADEAGSVSDWMFGVVKRGKTTFAELAPNIGKTATIAATAGVELNELGAMLAVLTRNGISTEEAVTSLNAIISTFLKPTDEAQQLAKQLGFDLSSATIQAEGLEGVFRKIASLPPDAISKLFPNVRALKGVLPALRNLEGFAEDMELLGNAAGLTAEAHKKMADTIGAAFNKVKQIAIQASVEIGTALAADLEKGADAVKAIGEYVIQWVKSHQSLVSVLGKSALVIGAVAGGLLALAAAAKTAAWAIGGVALAGKAASASLAFLVAHPAILALAAIAAVTVAVGVAMDYAAQSCLSLSEAQDNLLKTGDKRRKQDQDLLNRLQYLSQQEQLSNKQKEEAAAIIERLQSRYGDLGLSMDETTGKIYGMTSAYGEMAAAMQRDTERQIRSALREASTNAVLASEEINRLRDAWMSRSAKESEIAHWTMEMERANARAKELQSRLESLKEGDSDATTGGPEQKGSYAQAVLADKAAAKDAAKYEENLAERLHQARLAMIEDQYKRELETIRAKHMAEREEAKKTGRDLANRLAMIEDAQQREIDAIRAKHQAEREEAKKTGGDLANRLAKIEDEQQRELDAIRTKYETEREEAKKTGRDLAKLLEVQAAEVGVIHEEHRRREAEEEKRREDDRARNQKDLQEEIEEMEIKVNHEGLDQQLKLLELERKRRIADAPISGESVADINKLFDLQEQLAKSMDAAKIEQRTSVSGTFSAQMAARMGGSVEDKQLRTLEDIARTGRETKEEIRKINRAT